MLTAPGETVRRARKLRKTMSLPEILLWRALQKRLGGFKFRKQHPAGFFAIDFFCAEAKLAIEVDGQAHDRGDQPAFDAKRDAWLCLHNIKTLRVPATVVLNNLDAALVHILEALRLRLPLHHPPAADGPPPHSGEDLKDTP